ncbi:hypothetical protein [Polaribacter sp.]|uniref:hypothetical protein n=1 Tax=Polaribacter sp. TaxID=1920175 RepID=UPI003F6CC060
MKKILFIAILTIVSLGNLNAQESIFSGGLNIGLPTGNLENSYDAVLGAELYYMLPAARRVAIGPAVEYTHFLGKETDIVNISDASFLPISGAIRFSVTPKFLVGTNLGYALGLSDGLDGGFYYKPMIGYNITNNSQLNITYSSINSNIDMTNLSLGVLFRL